MDKLAILRGLHFVEEHSAHSLWTGYPERINRPAFGSVVSYLKGSQDGLPPYVSLMNQPLSENPAYCGTAHRPFVPNGPGLEDLSLAAGVSLDRLQDRKQLLGSLDTIRRDIDYRGALAGIDAYTVRALDMVASSKSREAFDIGQGAAGGAREIRQGQRRFSAGPPAGRSRHLGRHAGRRRLGHARQQFQRPAHHAAEARSGHARPGHRPARARPEPRCGRGRCGASSAARRASTPRPAAIIGRGPGSAVLAGGNFKTGQVIGETDARGEAPIGLSMTSSHVLTSLYEHLGIDPGHTIPDNNGRPMYLLDEREPVPGLV